jgi:5-methylthioadenosine/S-adenosylhomocysteine deaminase
VSGATVRVAGELGGRGLYYHELLGPDAASASATLEGTRGEVERLMREAPSGWRVGISPHAPYTVSAELAVGAARWARRAALPVATHLAESRAEQRFLTEAAGPFAERWRELGLPVPRGIRSAVYWAEVHGLLRPGFLAVHAVFADARDLHLLAERGAAVSVCPRSNERHGHGAPPLAAMLDAGLAVGLGTDSAASVGRLDVLAEARTARALARLSAEQALQLATLGGARALGLEQSIGSLEVGKWADFCVVRGAAASADQAAAVLERLLGPAGCVIISTYVAGRRVYDS